MKILLISANTEQIYMPVLPLGMACVAAAVQNAGHDVKTINLMMRQDTRTLIEQAINAFSPEVIGISVRNIDDQFMDAPRFFLDLVKGVVADCRNSSTAPIVLGGAGYSIFPKAALAYLGADMGIQGEGEAGFVMLLEHLSRKTDLSGIQGLYLSSGNRQRPEQIRNLDELSIPLPNVHLTPHSEIRNDEIWIPFQTRRGCSMNCSYCSTATIEGNILRKHSPQTVVEGIRRYIESGFHQFYFVDNTFNLPPSYAKELCDGIINTGLNIKWRCILYPWKTDDTLIEKMAKAGCKEVSFGFESGSDKILQCMNKKFTTDDVRRISEILKKHGIKRMGFLLLGGPGETKDTVEQSLHFADSLNLEAMKIATGIRIYPYTTLARIAVQEHVIAPEEDLLFPKFYMVPSLQDWLSETVKIWMKDHPHWQR
ncbi:MAG: radical SAM protein [Deltaproteobacteria bacterium]